MNLSKENPVITLPLGDVHVRFHLNATAGVGMTLIPEAALDAVAELRPQVDGIEREPITKKIAFLVAHMPQNCVQLKLRGDGGPSAFAQGRTLRGGPSVESLRFERIETVDTPSTIGIITHLRDATGRYACRQFLMRPRGAPYIHAWTEFDNTSDAPLTLELLSSFCIDGLTPFHRGAGTGRMRLHRFRSVWAAEGRHEALPLEDLHLERSWAGYGVFCERFGQVGSMPVRGFFPWVGFEDTKAGVFWGAQLAHPGSWQMEVYRRHDKASISGGLADREFGHWWKTVAPGETFRTPRAALACVRGDLEALCAALLQSQDDAAPVADNERDLPIIFNEWCSTWGNPSHENVMATARLLKRTPTRYFVIDDGWAERPGNEFQQNGDWIVNTKAFPGGLKNTCDALRALGITPGVWFEFEVCNGGSKAFEQTDHHLRRDGVTLQIGSRRFWDFRDPWVFDYLSERVIGLLKESGFGYLKVDYNETLGMGVDESGVAAPGSPGEGLRQHLEAVQRFFRKIREEVPGIVIENCSSGGHRLEPSMQAITSMGSFSDAHETVEIPIIAASLQYMILPRQSQVWAVLKETESLQRIRYSLAASFLGRMCVSGEIHQFSEEQMGELIRAQELYVRVAPVIRSGFSRVHREIGRSWREPQGWQAVVREGRADAAGRALVVVHAFDNPPASPSVALPAGQWRIVDAFGAEACGARIRDGRLGFDALPAWTGCVVELARD